MSDFNLIVLVMFFIYMFSYILNRINIGVFYGCFIISISNSIVIFSWVHFGGDYNYPVMRTIIYSLSMSIIILPIVYSVYKKF